MKAEYRDSAAAGNGIISLSGAIFPEAPWTLAIQRASDQKFLTGHAKNHWVGEAVFMPVDGEARADGSLDLAIGPNIVDQLDQLDQYALTLRGTGEEQKARLRVNVITYSPRGSLGNVAEVPDMAPESAPEPDPMPKPAAVQEPASSPESAPEAAPTAPAPEKPLEMPAPAQPADRKKTLIRIGIAALLTIGCIAWFLIDPRKEEGQQAAPPKASQMAESAEDQVRRFFQGEKQSPQKAAELASGLAGKTSADQDAIYRLWYFAAENGEASALLPYGASLDPSTAQYGSIEKDAAEAWRVYERLRSHDPAAANAAMNKMRSWLQDKAKTGDAKARGWLLQIDQPR